MPLPTGAFDQPIHFGDLFHNFTGTNTLTGPVRVSSILVATTSAGTIKVANAAGTIVNTITVAAGTSYPMPFYSATDVTITVTGTIDATVFYS